MVRSGGASRTLILSITYSDLSPGSGFNSLVKFMQACSSFSRFSLPHISLDWLPQEKYTLILVLRLWLSGGFSPLSSSCNIEHLCYNNLGQGLASPPHGGFRDCEASRRDCEASRRDCEASRRDCGGPRRDCEASRRDCRRPRRDCKASRRDCEASRRDMDLPDLPAGRIIKQNIPSAQKRMPVLRSVKE